MIRWDEELDNIKAMLCDGKTLEDIGKIYNVSKQRVYQVLQKYGIDTPTRQRKTLLKNLEPKYYWLNKMLIIKGFSSVERNALLQTLKLPDKCPILGIELNYNGTGVVGYSRSDNSPSVDQIVAGGGYTKDNIAIMSWRANRIKNDGTADEHKKIANWIEKQLQ